MTFALFTTQIGHYHDARYRAVAATGTSLTVIATQNEADFSEFMASSDGGYPVQQLFDGRSAYRRACAARNVWPAVQACLSALDPSVVAVAGWATSESFAAIAWARRHRRPLVMLSDSQRNDAKRSLWRERIKGRVVSLSDAALVAGPSHRDYVVRLGVPRENTFMGYDVVDNCHFSSGAQSARADQKAKRQLLGVPNKYLLASARFIPKKNLPRLIAAYGKATEARAEAPHLVVLGDGPERGAVEAAIAKAGLTGRVHLLGFRCYADLPSLYGLSDGFVHVPTSEQWGLVINEAAASGVPVVASSACGATASLVADGQTGLVVDAEDEVSISKGLGQLMDLNNAERQQMGHAAQERVADWGPDTFTRGLLSAYHMAKACPPRGLAPWDATLLSFLARQSISAVQ